MIRKHSRQSQAITDLVLQSFRLNGALLAAGDALVADLGLTSARWQVLGAIALAGRSLTVAQIARRMGLTRQAVQRVVNDLAAMGLLQLHDNPDHKRARLVGLTQRGAAVYGEADQRQIAWAETLAHGLTETELQTAVTVLRRITQRCDGEEG